jgi:phosphate transport system protein
MINPKFEEKRLDIRHKLKGVALMALSAHEMCYEGIKNKDSAQLDGVSEIIAMVDEKVNDIDNDIVTTLALFGLEACDLREFIAYLKITNEFERICVAARKYAQRIQAHFQVLEKIKDVHDDLLELHKCTINSISYAKDVCVVDDKEFDYNNILMSAKKEEERTDELFVDINKKMLDANAQNLMDDPFTIFNSIRRLERSADHAVNICALMEFARVGGKMDLF